MAVAAHDTVITLEEAKRFIVECMESVGTTRSHAEALGDLLVEADYRGHNSHGMNRLESYVTAITTGITSGTAVPKIIKESPATAWVDGQNALGPVVANFCMDLAIEKAKTVGVGWVSAKDSNHYGIAGMYTDRAIKKGVIGMSFTNTTPCLVPTRSKKATLGTNPLSVGAPATSGDSFLLDMATTTVAFGKIEMLQRKNLPIPEGWALDDKGNTVTDTEAAAKWSFLTPLGGFESTSGYKGTGLGVMVEIFSGILAGAAYGPNIKRYGTTTDKPNLGQSFVVIDPSFFAPGFEDRLSDLLDYIRHLEPIDPEKPVLVAGDPERQNMEAVDKVGGLFYVEDQLETCRRLATTYNVKPLQTLK